MASPFNSVRFHVKEQSAGALKALGSAPKLRGALSATGKPKDAFGNDESAARFFADQVLQRDTRPPVRGMVAPERPQVVPDLQLRDVTQQKLTKTKLVRFEQHQQKVPVFGSNLVVELTPDRQLVSVSGELAEIKKVSPINSVSAGDALKSIAALAGVPATKLDVEAPALNFFHSDTDNQWHLAWLFKRVPAVPKGFMAEAGGGHRHGHGLGRSPRETNPLMNYLVDAHDGKVLFYFSANPMLVKCKGVDEIGGKQEFFGNLLPGGKGFEMYDTLRSIKTFDLGGADITATAQFPAEPIRNKKADWTTTNRAAVSAHCNARLVHDFYKSVLQRDGIDDKGMELVSMVNCTYAQDESPPEWHNAVWYDNRMWYGQVKDTNGGFVSFSKYLDVIAHELTHGVTEHTADLVYKNQSGALNESYSDIFGIIIYNWATKGSAKFEDTSTWSWEIGPGLGDANKPLRDMKDPKVTGDPDHMNDYLNTAQDNGGVHTNSNIHNKAAYNVLTAKDSAGQVFKATDVAILYYLALQRLNSLADFAKTLQALIDVANTYFAGDAKELKRAVKAIRDAYKKVGIS